MRSCGPISYWIQKVGNRNLMRGWGKASVPPLLSTILKHMLTVPS